MATTAAIELLASRQYGRRVDLSEQHLWGMYKAFWAPGAGGSQFAIYQDALTGQYGNVSTTPVPLRPEAQWAYNRSNDCINYDGPCSYTYHQMPLKFTVVGNQTKMSIVSPIDNKSGGERYFLQNYSYIPADDRTAMLNQIKAELSLGRPVGIGYGVSNCISQAGQSDRPFVHTQATDCSLDPGGAHANVAVGWVTDDELEALYGREAPPRDGGGYLILRNSWGCTWGDRGYVYVSFQWAKNYLGGGRVFESISAQYPTATLKTSVAKLTAPGPVTLAATTNSLVKRVAFLHGSPTRGLRDAGTDQSAPFGAVVQLLEADRGPNTFIAVGYDENNNPVVTNMVQTVLASPGDPTISLSSPLLVDRNAEFKLTASVFDDSGIDRVTLRENGVVKVVRLGPPWEFKRTQAAAGDYIYTATVRSKDGVEVTSAPRTVTVMPDNPPTINAFSVAPWSVAPGGGNLTINWSTSGADTVELVTPSSGTRTLAATGSTVVNTPGYECIALRAVNARDVTSSGRCIARAPEITSFTATPATLPPGGGTVTLSWTVADVPSGFGKFDFLAITPTVGQVPNVAGKAPLSGSVTVTVTQATTFTLTVRDDANVQTYGVRESTASASVAVTQPDTTPPTVSLAASTTNVTSPQTLTLTATASDNVGVTKVEFRRGATKIGEDTSAPYTFDVPLTAADNGSATFTARAFDAAGNGSSSSVVVNVNIPVTDTTPPTVSLASSASSVTSAQTLTLTASASDNIGVTKVEFYRGATKLGEDTSAPFTASLALTSADNGSLGFTARAFDAAGNQADSSAVTVNVAIPVSDTIAPTVSLSSSATQVTTPQTITLTAQASDNVGVARVEFYRGATKLGEDTTAPYTANFAVTAAQNGSNSFVARAFDAAGNQADSGVVTVNVNIPVPDTTPPTVSLSANPTAVTAPGSTTLAANASDNVGIARVEFYEGAAKIGEALAAPYTFTRSYAANESGSFSYVAVAYDTSGNFTNSVARLVNVTAANSADRYVAPTGSDANPGTQAQPYLTLTKALAQVGSGGTVWVAPGTYTWAGEVAAGAPPLDGRTVPMPAGITLRASTPGSATLNFGLRAAGSATVIGLHLTTVNGDTSFGYGPAVVLPNNAAVQLKGVTFGRFTNIMSYCNGCANATVSIDTNGVANFNYLASDFTGEFTNTNTAHASGSVTVTGGRFSHPALASTGQTCNQGKFMSLGGSAQVTLDGVAVELGPVSGGISNHPIAFCLGQTGGTTTAKLTLSNGSTVTQAGTTSRYRAFAVAAPASLELASATVSGPFFAIVGTTGPAQVTVANSTLQGATEGITNNAGEYSEPTVTLTNSVLQNFGSNAVHLPHGGSVSVSGGQIATNGSAGIRLGGVAAPGFYTGVYTLTLRSATLTGNGGSAGDGAGLVLAGAAGSSFDLGTAAQPGGSTLQGLSASKPALRTSANAAVTVNAVGNTWTANQQGANASGQYSGNLLVTSGSGVNYAITSGSLRLAGP
jgi:hypothetical protein